MLSVTFYASIRHNDQLLDTVGRAIKLCGLIFGLGFHRRLLWFSTLNSPAPADPLLSNEASHEPTHEPAHNSSHLGAKLAIIVFVFCIVLFGYASFTDRPLTLHEARLPQTAREMLYTGHFSYANSSDRPWVERPPLPQWMTVIAGQLTVALTAGLKTGLDDASVARFVVALVGALTCVLTALSAARLFGRNIGVMSGLLLATTYEFYIYATRAEDEVYLAGLVALCFYAYLRASIDKRRVWMLVFFVSLGLTHLVRGPLVGMAQVGVVLLVFHVVQSLRARNWRELFAPIGPTFWVVGLLGSVLLGGAWYVWIALNVPGFVGNLRYDLAGPFGHDPWWYYIPTLLWTLLPWTFFSIIGAARLMRSKTHTGPFASSLFTLVWAIAPVLLMSIPARKHHHYLVPVFAGWAVLGAIGLATTWTYLLSLKPMQMHSNKHSRAESSRLLRSSCSPRQARSARHCGPVRCSLFSY